MSTIEKSVEVEVPLSTAYNQWTQFEEFPQFMDGVEQVQQLTDTRLRWHANISGVRREWEAEIVRQEPDRCVAWRSLDGTGNAGEVRFSPIGPAKTRVDLTLDYEPAGAVEKAGEMLGFVSQQAEGDLERFKQIIEQRQIESGAWRGSVG